MEKDKVVDMVREEIRKQIMGEPQEEKQPQKPEVEEK